MNVKGMIFDLQRNSLGNGPGLRTTVFFKGCNLNCRWCHNPESQKREAQTLFYKEKCTSCGGCATGCPNGARVLCGEEILAEELVEKLLQDRRFYEVSGGGVTFSGGECMLQIDFLEEVLIRCQKEGLHTAVDTAGHVPFEFFERILPHTDLFLYDVKSMNETVHREFVGVSSALILENLARLLQKKARVTVRFPVIAGINDNVEEMKLLRRFYEKNGDPETTELLSYHALGEHKYPALGREMPRFSPPTKETLAQMREILEEK